MSAALEQARRGVGLTSPNPPVGCVIVRDGQIIGRGFHARAGGPHAEVEAIASIANSELLKGSTAYVTLEPCSTTGKTPPCCSALIAAGIARVVYGTDDPNPAHAGRGREVLEKAGIEVVADVEGEACRALIRPWAHFMATGMPWVVAKAGMSLDGRLTRPAGEGQWLTSETSRADAQRLRAEVDAILIGAGTLRADDPSLTIRDPAATRAAKRQPWRVVLTAKGDLPSDAKLFVDEHRERTLVCEGRDLADVLRSLAADRDCVKVMIEGGGNLLGRAFQDGLVDEVQFYMAPLICGADTVSAIGVGLPSSVELDAIEVLPMERDFRLTGLVNKAE